MEIPWALTVRTWLGVAWSAHFLLSSLATGLDEAYNNNSNKTTAIPDNSSYSTDHANRTNHGNWESESEGIFASQGFINGVIGAVSVVLGVGGWCLKSHFRKRRAGQQPAASAAPPPVPEGGQPAPQTWSLTSATSSSLPSGVTTATAQPSTLFSTTSVSGIDYSNNNFLSNYSTASTYSNVGRL